ncbi:MAG: hypothetical protein QM831_26935 [Kofleriaceae bacterium]
MADTVSQVLEITRGLRKAHGLSGLTPGARAAFVRDLDRLDATLTSKRYDYAAAADPYAQALDVTDLEQRLRGSSPPPQQPAAPPPAAPAPAAKQTAEIGQRAATALEAIDFPGFVASLLTGTFQAIVDSSAQQVRSYAELVASLTQSLEDFSSTNVNPDQAREKLAQQYPKDLVLTFPPTGVAGSPKLLPRPDAENTSPDWLKKYDLEGEQLTAELTDGPLVTAGRKQVGEDRLQTLATMVLMGINRVVVNDGDVRAKLQFHAQAQDVQRVAVEQQGLGIAGRTVSTDAQAQMMVSTVKVNAQADAAIRADLMGEVRISFRTETFPLERFADSAAIQLINRHARWQGATPQQPATPTQETTPAPATPPDRGETPK